MYNDLQNYYKLEKITATGNFLINTDQYKTIYNNKMGNDLREYNQEHGYYDLFIYVPNMGMQCIPLPVNQI